MKGRAGRQRSHIPLFSTQSLVLSSCVFTPFPEGIKVNMPAYPPLPHTGWAFVAFICASSPSIHHSFTPIIPSFLSSCSIGGAIWDSLVWPCITTAQICSVSPCISYLLCLTSRDKPVFITLTDLFSKSVQHRHTHTHLHKFRLHRMPTNQPRKPSNSLKEKIHIQTRFRLGLKDLSPEKQS